MTYYQGIIVVLGSGESVTRNIFLSILNIPPGDAIGKGLMVL
jgi:hypothetical protein